MRAVVGLGLSTLLLAACGSSVPDSGTGVGFGGSDAFRAEQQARDAALAGTPEAFDDRTQAAVDALVPGAAPLPEEPSGAGIEPGLTSAQQAEPGISDEQNFDAVSGRETIESDAARIAANREQFRVVQPSALPTRSGNGPNVVEYALRTTNVVGQSLYSRLGLTTRNGHLRRCAEYASADQAQQAFLAAGGPERDRRGLDPDGDGFACRWDPAPFRAVTN